MSQLSRQRCFHHSHREAAARCPECRRDFCRECVTEHEGRVLCATCLSKKFASKQDRRYRWELMIKLLQLLLGLWVAWSFFYYSGQALLKMPESFHEGTIWKEKW